jgi:hypothetical protein
MRFLSIERPDQTVYRKAMLACRLQHAEPTLKQSSVGARTITVLRRCR